MPSTEINFRGIPKKKKFDGTLKNKIFIKTKANGRIPVALLLLLPTTGEYI